MIIFYVIQNYQTLEYLGDNPKYDIWNGKSGQENIKQYIFTKDINKAYQKESYYECEKLLEDYLEYFDCRDGSIYQIIKLYKD